MKRTRLLFQICMFIFMSMQVVIGAESDTSPIKLIKLLSKELSMDRSALKLSSINNSCLTSEYVTEIFRVKDMDEEIGFAVAAKGKGRYDSFDYLIFYNEERAIRWVIVTAYYSDHGGQIASKRWLGQFNGYSGGKLEYGDDVQAISGATLSAGSITKGIKEITTLIQDCDL